MRELDVRDMPPTDRHPEIMAAFEEMDPGETLRLINDHDPKPLYHEMRAERDSFDEEGYDVTRESPERFIAPSPKN